MGNAEMEKVAAEVRSCAKCGLHETRSNAVPGEGSRDAAIMLVGEAPGLNEDRQGRPFVGRAGKVLDGLLESAGIERGDVFITNIVKCRPPGNRNPKAGEIRSCTAYLDRQLSIMRPGKICPMGNFAARYVMEKFGLKPESIGKIHGKAFMAASLAGGMKIIPLYHPASAV